MKIPPRGNLQIRSYTVLFTDSHHPSSSTFLEDRIVIEAVVKKSDVLWDRIAEAEMVLKVGFCPMSAFVTMTYDDYKEQQ